MNYIDARSRVYENGVRNYSKVADIIPVSASENKRPVAGPKGKISFTEFRSECNYEVFVNTVVDAEGEPIFSYVTDIKEKNCSDVSFGVSSASGSASASASQSGTQSGSGSGAIKTTYNEIPGGNTRLEVKDSLVSPCLQFALAKARAAKNGITAMMNQRSEGAVFADVEMTVVESDSLANTEVANTRTSSGQVRITINNNIASDYSQEYMVATMYHEILHGLFDTWQLKDKNKKFPDQHGTIAGMYINMLNRALITAFPEMTWQEARLLTWGGLASNGKTPIKEYDSLSQQTKDSIAIMNDRHKRTPPPGAPPRKGHYCPDTPPITIPPVTQP